MQMEENEQRNVVGNDKTTFCTYNLMIHLFLITFRDRNDRY